MKWPSVEELRVHIQSTLHGKIAAEHDEQGHHYRFMDTGTVVDSVTTKLIVEKPLLRAWSVRQALRWLGEEGRVYQITEKNMQEMFDRAEQEAAMVKEEASDIGSEAHDVIDRYMRLWMQSGERPEDIRHLVRTELVVDDATGRKFATNDPRVYAIARNAEAAIASRPVVPIASEVRVGSEEMRSAGTVDAVFLNTETNTIEMWDWKSSNSIQDTHMLQIAAYTHMFQEMTGLKVQNSYVVRLDKFKNKFTLHLLLDFVRALEAFSSISRVYDWLYDGQPKSADITRTKAQMDFDEPEEKPKLEDGETEDDWLADFLLQDNQNNNHGED